MSQLVIYDIQTLNPVLFISRSLRMYHVSTHTKQWFSNGSASTLRDYLAIFENTFHYHTVGMGENTLFISTLHLMGHHNASMIKSSPCKH